jgi:hypothetical protein
MHTFDRISNILSGKVLCRANITVEQAVPQVQPDKQEVLQVFSYPVLPPTLLSFEATTSAATSKIILSRSLPSSPGTASRAGTHSLSASPIRYCPDSEPNQNKSRF